MTGGEGTKKIVLGFSGGLDTSYCAIYLKEELGYEVHSVTVNTGGFTAEEIEGIEAHAYRLGVASHTTVDALKSFYEQIVKYLIFGNCLKNNTYPLSVSAERLTQALQIADHIKKMGAVAVAHGSTGAGNDQVRFDMILNIMVPDAEIITPIRDLSLTREQEVSYLKEKGVQMNFEKSRYSINKGLWGTSVGGVETLRSKGLLPEAAWPTQVTKSGSEEIKLTFFKGELRAVNETFFDHPVLAIQHLQALAGGYGVGRDIHVGDTIIGIKGRVGFEAAAPMIIIKAHQTLEKHVMTKLQLNLKDQLSEYYTGWLHEGLVLDPVMRNIEAYLTDSQQLVSGAVYIKLQPYWFQVIGIESEHDLLNAKFGSYGEVSRGYSGADVRGFTKIFGNQIKIYERVNHDVE